MGQELGFGIWTFRLKELGKVYLVQLTADGLGSVALDMGCSSVLEGESGVYNCVYIDLYSLDEFDGLCFFTCRYYCAKSSPLRSNSYHFK